MNSTRATISPGYRWRLVLITLVMLGFGVYCLYDGYVAYPLQLEKYQTHQRIMDEYPQTYPQEWARHAAEQGWDERTPKKRTERDIFTQFLMAGLVFPIGLFFLYKLIRENGRWVEMDERGLKANGGREVPWDAIQSLDDSRWKTKGIAYVHYRDGSGGGEKRLLLDDFKSQREPIKAIVHQVQQHLNPTPAEPEALAPQDPDSLEAQTADQPPPAG
jgi:hypothetical protein